jgi:hypothetical protein
LAAILGGDYLREVPKIPKLDDAALIDFLLAKFPYSKIARAFSKEFNEEDSTVCFKRVVGKEFHPDPAIFKVRKKNKHM